MSCLHFSRLSSFSGLWLPNHSRGSQVIACMWSVSTEGAHCVHAPLMVANNPCSLSHRTHLPALLQITV